MSDEQWLTRAEDLVNARISNEAGVCLYCGDQYLDHDTTELVSCLADLRARER